MPAWSLFVAAYGSAFIANTWYPSSKSTFSHAMEQGSSKIGSTIGLHLLHEFWPDMKRIIHRKRSDSNSVPLSLSETGNPERPEPAPR